MNNHALLIIDYTNDFVADQGALSLKKPAQACENRILELAEKFRKNQQFVILPTDVHQPDDPYHPESKLFPTHNVRNTWGRCLYGGLQTWYEKYQQPGKIWQIDKTRYSAFTGTDLDLRLRERQVSTVHLVGVATDICLLHTAISAYNLNYQIILHTGGSAGFTGQNEQFVFDHLKSSLGAKVIE